MSEDKIIPFPGKNTSPEHNDHLKNAPLTVDASNHFTEIEGSPILGRLIERATQLLIQKSRDVAALRDVEQRIKTLLNNPMVVKSMSQEEYRQTRYFLEALETILTYEDE